MIRIGLLGVSGKMGQWVSRLIQTDYQQEAALAASAGRGVALDPLLQVDAVIDFSSPAAMQELARLALKSSGRLPVFVVGSTGWKLDERKVLEELAKRTPVLMASNFSTGVLVLVDLLKQAAPILEKLGYTPVIVEAHHKHKKDAPSGTAISLQRAIAPAGPGNIQTHSIRAGEIVGDHEVTFHSDSDHIRIGHYAQGRSIFARGAIDVAIWLSGRRDRHAGVLIGIDQYYEDIKCSS